jgi:hypothetical protein
MNRVSTLVAEKFLDLAYTWFWTPNTPNPFETHDRENYWWLDLSPEEFYAVPDAPPHLEFGRELRGPRATHVRFKFPSPFQSAYAENNTVYGLANLRPQGKARAAMIFLHGHAMNSLLPMEWLARSAITSGLDVYYLTLPYHMRRAPRGTWGGQLSLNSSISGTALSFMQGVQDLRAMMNWVEKVAGLPIVLAGISLGAFTACMASVVDPRPRALVSVIGGSSLAQLVWDGYRLGHLRQQMEEGGVTQAQLERYWALLGPGNWWPRVDPARVLVIGGQYDPIVTPSNVKHLWKAWGTPPIRWYPAGHTTIGLYHKEMDQEIAGFLNDRV